MIVWHSCCGREGSQIDGKAVVVAVATRGAVALTLLSCLLLNLVLYLLLILLLYLT